MSRPLLPTVLALLLIGALTGIPATASDDAEHWPKWRGPLDTGVAPNAEPPLEWSEDKNVRFKVEVPGHGLASPVIWGDLLFLLTAASADEAAYAASQQAAADKMERQEWPPAVEPVPQRFLVMAYSTRDGSLVWQRLAAEKVPHETHYLDASWASASPVTDGKRVFASFGSNGLFAYTIDGEFLWSKDLGDMTTRNGFGEGSSPALFGETLVINWDHEEDSFVVALDAQTGEERWRQERPDEVTSWATPLVVEHGGRHQVIVPATGKSRGYDLETGEELWSLGGMTVNTIPTPVHRDGVVYLTSGYRGTILQAVDLAHARGELEGTKAVRFTHDRHTPYVPSPIIYDDSLYFLKHLRNIMTHLDAESGEIRYTEKRLEGIQGIYASPVAAAGKIYVVGKKGTSVVLRHSPEFEVLATNSLDDRFDASPAIAGDTLYLRGTRYLYALAEQAEDESPAAEPTATEEATDAP